jgi:hypothetical protein
MYLLPERNGLLPCAYHSKRFASQASAAAAAVVGGHIPTRGLIEPDGAAGLSSFSDNGQANDDGLAC